MSLTVESVIEALRPVQDPELHRGLVELGMIKDVAINGRDVSFEVVLTTPACPLKDQIHASCEQAIRRVHPSTGAVNIRWGAQVRRGTTGLPGRGAEAPPDVKNIILVGAGKGGVGKSTVSANLAVALAHEGARVGLLDADVYGPSMPIMFAVHERPAVTKDQRIIPVDAAGIKLMSAGFLIEDGQAVIWRGPMLNSLIVQFLKQVEWGELDYLIVDLPPGTGDVQITISQHVQATGAVLVGTPQDVAMADVLRAKDMFDKVRIPVLGIVENMSLFVCDGCGKVHDIFSTGGTERVAGELGIPFLGRLPIDKSIRVCGDFGKPFVAQYPKSETADAFRRVARSLAGRVSIAAEAQGAQVEIAFH